MTLAETYWKLFRLRLELTKAGKIKVSGLSSLPEENARNYVRWLVENREHAISRLKAEGWRLEKPSNGQ